MNLRTLRLLEYNKIVEMLTSYAASPMAKRKCERLKPRRDLTLIQTLQQETRDALIRLNTQGNLSFAGLRDIGASIKRLEVQGALGIKELLDIGSVLDMALSARQYGSGDDNEEKAHDSLYSRFMELVPLEHLSQEIHRCILSESEIADDASSGLKAVRRNKKLTNEKLHNQLNKLVTDQSKQTMFQDNLITMRNGRYCIPVKQEYKNSFPGMIHDQSSSGNTVFIEPLAVVNLNNQLKELDNQELAEQINVSMSQYLHSMMRLSDTLYYNIIKGHDRGQMKQMFQAMYDGYKDYVESIALFQEDGTLLQVMPALSSAASSDVMQEEWFSSALERSENIHFFRPQIQDCFEHNSSFPWVIPMSRFVQITHGNQVLSGVLLINIKYSALSEVFRNSTDDMNQYSFLMDSNGELIYHPRHALVNSGIIEKPPETLAEYQDGSYETEIGKQQVFCSVKTVGYTGWKIIRVIGKEELRSYGIKSTFFVLAVICQVVLFFQVVGSYISMVLTRPICNLEEDVKRISAGELDIKVHTAGSFEVYHLGRSIQKMTVRIKKLMREVIQEQEAKRKSELDSLQAQITPHFLYNTLDIVVWMIEENRKEDAAGMVTALARFLRISLSKGKNIITVADELEHARNYLMIQSLRAKDQFTYRIEKDPGTECFQVIKLIVQPIVENALYHGLEGMYGDGEIVIHAYTKDGDLYISVKDNGMGMSKEQAEALLDYTKELKTAKGNGIGVRNVHERIQLHFGKEYGVQIISEEDEGTEILLHLPAIMYGEKKE